MRYLKVERCCRGCGQTFRGTRKAIWCSEKCRKRVGRGHPAAEPTTQAEPIRVPFKHDMACVVCGKDFKSSQSNAKHCSTKCRIKSQFLRKCKQREFVCDWCGKRFARVTTASHIKFCSEGCCSRSSRSTAKSRRNGRLSHPGRDTISLSRLTKRHGGQCVYCGKACTLEHGHLHDDAPTRDHVVPISKGGKHVWSNVVLACRACNVAKGDGDIPTRGRLVS